jgi:murein DD-endopeptidase MepM/ murein hydrolase activator NlpD
VTPPLDPVVERATRAADAAAGAPSDRAAERQRLERLASEFESMLMAQVLRDMRRTTAWDEEGASGAGEAQSLFEMLDAELAVQMSRVQGFGLTRQLLEAFDRSHGGLPATSDAAGTGAAEDSDRAGRDAAGHAALSGRIDAAAVTSAFGWRADPLTGEARFHRGVDLRAAYGQDVPAAAAGRVVFSGSQGGYGTTVLLEHADGTRTRYAHLSAALVQTGDDVGAGGLIGRAGQSGRATGTHVHFEVLDAGGTPVDPLGR